MLTLVVLLVACCFSQVHSAEWGSPRWYRLDSAAEAGEWTYSNPDRMTRLLINRNDGDRPLPWKFSAYAKGLDETRVFDSEGTQMTLEASDEPEHPVKDGWQMFQYKGNKVMVRRDPNNPVLMGCQAARG